MRAPLIAAAITLAILPGKALQAQTAGSPEELVDQFSVDVQSELEMLGFIKSMIETIDTLLPMCREAPSGNWPDALGEIRWDDNGFAQLRAGLEGCRDDYDRLYRSIADRVPDQTQLLDSIVRILEDGIAANQVEFHGDLTSDPRGISYSCGTMLKITELCPEAAKTE